MQKTILWEIVPLNQPTISKKCSKCGTKCTFITTGNFRLNANQNKVDVWLIYQCQKCKTTWNMSILTRVNPSAIPQDLYRKFLSNDGDLARKYAFDANIHAHNNVTLNYEELDYDIRGDIILLTGLSEPIRLQIVCNYTMDIRVDKILSQKLGISRSLLKRLGLSGKININNGKELWKTNLSNDLIITILP